jgi:hypothetical protein
MQNVFASSYLVSAKNASVLVSRLEATLAELSKIEQTDDGALPPGVDTVAAQLVSSHVLRSSSKAS